MRFYCDLVLQQLAGVHGYPDNYCTHRQENFPAWHRAYLCSFETALGAADLELGNDGSIGLPYYDWLNLNVEDQAYPVVVDAMFSELPTSLLPHLEGTKLAERGYQLRSGKALVSSLQRLRLNEKVEDALLETEHWKFASTRWRNGTSLEVPHNDVHVAMGYPMNSVKFASYHPMFFLHHCQIDRIFETYLEMEVDSRSEFAARQRSLAQEFGETNRFEQPLEPL